MTFTTQQIQPIDRRDTADPSRDGYQFRIDLGDRAGKAWISGTHAVEAGPLTPERLAELLNDAAARHGRAVIEHRLLEGEGLELRDHSHDSR